MAVDFLKGLKAIWFIRSEFSFGADLGYWKTLSKVSAYFSAPNYIMNLSFIVHGNIPR